MRRQLRVTKVDGTDEAYLHTKVIGTINNALAAAGQGDIVFAEDLAEVVTFYLYKKLGQRRVNSNEIYSMIKAVLAATGHEEAALALTQHTFERRLKRTRTEVLALNLSDFADAQKLHEMKQAPDRSPWDKAHIVHDLTSRFDVPYHMARAVASSVEERIFRMELTTVSLGLIKQLVLGEMAALFRAQQELGDAEPPSPDESEDVQAEDIEEPTSAAGA
jgi:hypothetical protein